MFGPYLYICFMGGGLENERERGRERDRERMEVGGEKRNKNGR